MVRGKILLAILNQREQKADRDLGLKIFQKEVDKNDLERADFQVEGH